MAEATDGAARNTLAFDRAVRREREATVLHERAAAVHETIAARLTEAALTAVDLIHAGLLREHAAAEHDLANVARARAAACAPGSPRRASPTCPS